MQDVKDEQSEPEVSDEFYCVEIVNINDVVERREERGLSHCTTLPTVTCSSVENIILSSSDQLNREIVFHLIVIFFQGGYVAM